MFEPKAADRPEPSHSPQRAAPQLAENRRVVNTPVSGEPRKVMKAATELKIANAPHQKKPGWIEWKPSATYDADAEGERLTLDNYDREIGG